MSAITPLCDFGWKAPAFELPATDGITYRLGDIQGATGTLVMFICNHCPYVQAILAPLLSDLAALTPLGVRALAISSNDAVAYPEDSFTAMGALATRLTFPFPYLYDERQSVAKAYNAICTPDFFGFNANLELQYRGRLDASRKEPILGARRDLLEAMTLIAQTGQGPLEQFPSVGCSIKWRPD